MQVAPGTTVDVLAVKREPRPALSPGPALPAQAPAHPAHAWSAPAASAEQWSQTSGAATTSSAAAASAERSCLVGTRALQSATMATARPAPWFRMCPAAAAQRRSGCRAARKGCFRCALFQHLAPAPGSHAGMWRRVSLNPGGCSTLNVYSPLLLRCTAPPPTTVLAVWARMWQAARLWAPPLRGGGMQWQLVAASSRVYHYRESQL